MVSITVGTIEPVDGVGPPTDVVRDLFVPSSTSSAPAMSTVTARDER